MENVVLEVKNLSKSFAHDGGQIHVLTNLNLTIYKDDFTVVMGSSGSGKSTLLYAISGMDKATSGSVLYNGNDIKTLKEQELDINEYATELFKRMDIDDVKTHLPSQVSGGEQQRCAIARAIINKPQIVFADEPTGALNKKNSIEVLDILSDLNNQGQSIIMVTHDIRGAIRADRIIYLSDGNVIGDLRLHKYKKEDEKSREAQINAWLNSLEW